MTNSKIVSASPRPGHFRQDYLDRIHARIAQYGYIELAIMGKDEYPNRNLVTGIPFCTPRWDEMCHDDVSGLYVLLALKNNIGGIQRKYEDIPGFTFNNNTKRYVPNKGVFFSDITRKFSCPEEYFFHLADKGIVFLNMAYAFLAGEARKTKHQSQLMKAAKINDPILSHSKNILLCGEAGDKYHWYGNKPKHAQEVVHPDIRCRISGDPTVNARWHKAWIPNCLYNLYGKYI